MTFTIVGVTPRACLATEGDQTTAEEAAEASFFHHLLVQAKATHGSWYKHYGSGVQSRCGAALILCGNDTKNRPR